MYIVLTIVYMGYGNGRMLVLDIEIYLFHTLSVLKRLFLGREISS